MPLISKNFLTTCAPKVYPAPLPFFGYELDLDVNIRTLKQTVEILKTPLYHDPDPTRLNLP